MTNQTTTFLQSSYSKINIQVRGTPKNFQAVERKKKITPAVRRAPSAHFSEASSFSPKSLPLGSEVPIEVSNSQIDM